MFNLKNQRKIFLIIFLFLFFPVFSLVRAVLDPVFRRAFGGGDGWMGLVMAWIPYVILTGAACRPRLGRFGSGALIGGLMVVLILFAMMECVGDGGGVTQGGINAGVLKLLLVYCQYGISILSLFAGLVLDWVTKKPLL